MILPLRDLYQDDGLFWQRNCRMLCRAQDPNLDLDNHGCRKRRYGLQGGQGSQQSGLPWGPAGGAGAGAGLGFEDG